MFKSLFWLRKSKIVHTVLTLKRLSGELKEDFNNKELQDAKAFLMFLINTFHQVINLNSKNNFVKNNNYAIYNQNTPDEIGNIHWSNNLINNASFIDSIFKYQIKIESKCKKCGNSKYNFENDYILNLPILKCRLIHVEIYLYKLPFQYKYIIQK